MEATAGIESELAWLREHRGETALFTDLDGTLAPIADRAELARIDPRGRRVLAELAESYAVTGVVTGRAAADARRMLGFGRMLVIGNHGAETLEAGSTEAVPLPELAGAEPSATEFADRLDRDELEAAGLRIERKGPFIALHWRGAGDLEAAGELVERIEHEAGESGLRTHRGRMVLELRPPVEVDKGRGMAAVIERAAGIRAAFFAGDDRTDADGFRLLERLHAEGRLERVVTIAVLSEETPEEVAEAARWRVDGIDSYVELLERLL